jgi:hypothetical protein
MKDGGTVVQDDPQLEALKGSQEESRLKGKGEEFDLWSWDKDVWSHVSRG